MKLLLIGVVMGLVIGGGLTILYFSLAYFFAVNARAADAFAKDQRVAESRAEMPKVQT